MKGLLFGPEMARQNVAGQKCETRRLAGLEGINAQELDRWHLEGLALYPALRRKPAHCIATFASASREDWLDCRARFTEGEIFYQKETWCGEASPQTGCVEYNEDGNTYPVLYKADGGDVVAFDEDGGQKWCNDGRAASPWKSGLMMPAWAARFFGRIEEVRCERLHDITEKSARREGVLPTPGEGERTGMTERSGVENYLAGFARINPKAPANPWVFVYRYRPISREEAFGG